MILGSELTNVPIVLGNVYCPWQPWCVDQWNHYTVLSLAQCNHDVRLSPGQCYHNTSQCLDQCNQNTSQFLASCSHEMKRCLAKCIKGACRFLAQSKHCTCTGGCLDYILHGNVLPSFNHIIRPCPSQCNHDTGVFDVLRNDIGIASIIVTLTLDRVHACIYFPTIEPKLFVH